MAVPGQTLVNPASGERITFRANCGETTTARGDRPRALPGRTAPPLHLHPLQEERFKSRRGRRASAAARPHRRGAGRGRRRPARAPATSPTTATDRRSCGLRSDRRSRWNGSSRPPSRSPSRDARCSAASLPLELALFTREFEQEVQTAVAPRWLQRSASHPSRWRPDAAAASSFRLALDGPAGAHPNRGRTRMSPSDPRLDPSRDSLEPRRT